jgi:hypothetical protein
VKLCLRLFADCCVEESRDKIASQLNYEKFMKRLLNLLPELSRESYYAYLREAAYFLGYLTEDGPRSHF